MRAVFAGLVVGLLLGVPAAAQSSSLVGVWDLRLAMPQGVQEATMTVSGSPGTYGVAFANSSAPAGPAVIESVISEVAVSGDTFAFTQTVSTPGEPVVIRYSFEIEGEMLEGEARASFGTVPITARRR